LSLDDDDLDDDEFLELMRSRMPEEHQAAADVLDRVNAVYVESARDRLLAKSFNRFMTFVTAKQRNGRRGKGNAFFITGQSGAGKTDIVEHLLLGNPMLQPRQVGVTSVKPYIEITLQGPATLAVLARGILGACGYPVKSTLSETSLWELLPSQLHNAKVLLIHIDETQHLIGRGVDKARVTSTIKGLMNYKPWPMSFVLSGMPELNNLKLHDSQAERRSYSFALEGLDPEGDGELIGEIIKKHCDAAGIKCDALLATDMPKRIAHAANYQFGRICEVVISGIHHAVLADERELTREQFARAYRDHSNTRGYDEMNPFHADDWRSLEPGYFSLDPEDHK
jgi:hypothetical protein